MQQGQQPQRAPTAEEDARKLYSILTGTEQYRQLRPGMERTFYDRDGNVTRVERYGEEWDESEHPRNRKGRFVPNPTHESLDDLVTETISIPGPPHGQKRSWVALRRLDKDEAQKLKEKTGLDLEGLYHTIDDSAIRHIWRFHGPKGSGLHEGQLPLTEDDLRKIGEITETADEIRYVGKTQGGLDGIEYVKRMNGWIYYVAEVRVKRRELAATTMKKFSSRNANGDPISPPLLTPKADRPIQSTEGCC